ncbi:non-hydrolyzing UDP-N-acetylglucosamine 2-epimerase [Nucisporomicrobium flavum]|uniref:non-hydrolyzing UDP-N-acetylglucosamine 2-epimerase n=1 Tax=Nucisporomicrobium flavum TaxID=2785915 RepID=UPI0018F73B5F|nr:UDP-N-acetylglucosamine 2-epimerase (non-hydrolyzing) [Nucisporomicrobium flavum]
MHKVMVIFGTRPEAIKLAPVITRLRDDRRFALVTVATAQHRSMLDQVLAFFGIVPDVDLDMLTPRQTLGGMTQHLLAEIGPLLRHHSPDIVLVQGDTTTACAASLAAYYERVPVAHLEAGLRTRNIWSPYPEEANRKIIASVAALHLAPTAGAAANLLAEAVPPETVVLTGNTVIDALLWAVANAGGYGDPALDDLDDDPARVLLVTAHRRESWGRPLERVGRALTELAAGEPDLRIVIPVHRNPAVREALLPQLRGHRTITVVEPLDYPCFCRLMNRSHLILTDSGGVQEEGPSLGKPVLVMRDTTERPEGVAAGTAALVGTDPATIVTRVRSLLHDPAAYRRMAEAVNPYGDGRAAERTIAALARFFDAGSTAEAFTAGERPLAGSARPGGL